MKKSRQQRTRTSATSASRAAVPDRAGRAASYVVGMVGSAGGLEAFVQFFSHLPADTGLAFVLVPHLEPTHKGMMPELLGRHTRMKGTVVYLGADLATQAARRGNGERRPVRRGEMAQASFAFLDQETTTDGVFWPVGNKGWYPRGEEKARYDQQPVEAVTMMEAAQAAFELLGTKEHLATFRRAHGWFHGRNSLKQPLGDFRNGACRDGLQATGVNRNQGAESTLAYLWAEISDDEVQGSLEGKRSPTSAIA